jgi:hypothetical protein
MSPEPVLALRSVPGRIGAAEGHVVRDRPADTSRKRH